MGEWDDWLARIARAHQALEGADYYAVLGVAPDSDARTIRQAYYRRAQQLHPDRLSGAPEPGRSQAASIFKRVSEAYQNLSDPVLRAAYDRTRQAGELRLSVVNRLTLKPREDGWFLKTEGGRQHYKAVKEALASGNISMAKLSLKILVSYEGDLPELRDLSSEVEKATASQGRR